MKHNLRRTLCGVLVLVGMILISCETQRKLMKVGHQQVELQMYEEAANTYLKALGKKRSNLDAQVAVRNTLAVVFENKSDRILEAFSNNQLEQLIAEYKQIETLSRKANSLGVMMNIPLKAEKLFEQSRDIVTNEKNAQAQAQLQMRNYESAKKLFSEVLVFNPSNEEAQAGVVVATNEPILANGMRLYEEGKYRAAYRLLKPIERYKDTKALVALALEKGTCTMLLIPSNQLSPAAFQSTAEYIRKYNNSPFLKVIFYSEMGSKLQEYGCTYTDLVRRTSRIRALADLGKIDCLLQITPLSFVVQPPRLQQQQLKGFDVVKVEKKKETGEVEKTEIITKVYYTVVTTAADQRVIGKMNATVVDTRNGIVLYEKNYIKERADKVSYIDYNGKLANLRTGDWKGKVGEPYKPDKGDVLYSSTHTLSEQITSLRNGRKTFRDVEADKASIISDLNKELANHIIAFTTND